MNIEDVELFQRKEPQVFTNGDFSWVRDTENNCDTFRIEVGDNVIYLTEAQVELLGSELNCPR